MKWLVAVLMVVLCLPFAARAQDLSALARLEPAQSFIRDAGQGVEVRFSLSQPVPWRVRFRADPPRMVLDVREVDWTGVETVLQGSAHVTGLRAGVFRPGWSRLVLDLSGPMALSLAEMSTANDTQLLLRLDHASPEAFAAAAAQPELPGWGMPTVTDLAKPPERIPGRWIVVLDPGHGGIDPGAERDGVTEADLVLQFAREFKELLLRDGRFQVVMTRDSDHFVPLETRISIARAAEADLFLSLHADALSEGDAVGVTLYSLSDEASDAASAAMAERHERDDLLAGVDLTAQDDMVATVLMDMARAETGPKIERVAEALQTAISGAGLKMHRRPHQKAGFSVLKSPDIPSLLIELGFISSAADLDRLQDPAWRACMAEALRQGIVTWAEAEATIRRLPALGD
ncbi:MAG: N-acetylmuramoyl-L-alanine amidase [Alphaproteobacteria bacterium]|nr:N-acetylmuramoyl-L-alanine amidase [Alphaproteobacteria bacterium]